MEDDEGMRQVEVQQEEDSRRKKMEKQTKKGREEVDREREQDMVKKCFRLEKNWIN